MENHTVRSRVMQLLQRSRRALRLYSSVRKSYTESSSIYQEMQAQEWRSVNAELLRHLTQVAERQTIRDMVRDIFIAQDRFLEEWRSSEQELQFKQRALIVSAESEDYTRAATLGNELVTLKARVQATHAAHHELNDLVRQSRLTRPGDGFESPDHRSVGGRLSDESSSITALTKQKGGTATALPSNNVIPLRKRRLGS